MSMSNGTLSPSRRDTQSIVTRPNTSSASIRPNTLSAASRPSTEITVSRPNTHSTVSRPNTHSTPRSRTTISVDVSPLRRSAKTQRSKDTHRLTVNSSGQTASSRVTAPDVELVQSDWPDLPPISQIKTAIARDRVSHGISYILPVDKTRMSVNNVYRTNLRAMFYEPYLNDHLDYDDDVIKTSARHHFRPNIAHTRFQREWVDPESYKLSSDVEKIRMQYAKSAPSTGLSSRKQMDDSNNLRTRSTLVLPIKMEIPEEAKRIKAEAEKIIREVREDNEDDFDPEEESQIQKQAQKKKLPRRQSQFERYYHEFRHMQEDVEETRRDILREKSKQFKRYKDFENLNLPIRPALPEDLKSSFLSSDKNDLVWDWLTHGEMITDHNFFLTICG